MDNIYNYKYAYKFNNVNEINQFLKYQNSKTHTRSKYSDYAFSIKKLNQQLSFQKIKYQSYMVSLVTSTKPLKKK